MTPSVSKSQIKAIHTLKSRARLDDDTYRAFLERETGKRSSTQLSISQAVKVIDRLKALTNDARSPAEAASSRKAKDTLTGPYAAKLRALWISGWHLGVVRDRRDAALLAFVRRQTGIDHTRWLREPADARRAIEALKAWLTREATVDWRGDRTDPKVAVIEAQLRLLGDQRTVADVCAANGGVGDHELMARLGDQIRGALQ